MVGPVNNSWNSAPTTSTQTTKSSRELLQEKLDAWVKASPIGTGEHREMAVQMINLAYEQHISCLDLSHLNLTSLPEKAFDGLNSLQVLSLNGNQLTSLPEKAFEGLSSLQTLDLNRNQLTSLPEKAFEGLSSLQKLYLFRNQLIFKPNIQVRTGQVFIELDIRYNIPTVNIPTVGDEFTKGNTEILDFLLTDERIPGASSERGRLKLDIMLKHANDHIIGNDQSTWQHSVTLNQLFYQASVLSDKIPQELAIKEQANTLLTRYLGKENIRQFAEQAEDMGIAPTEYEGLVFVTQDGTQGLTIHKDCYEANILDAPFANKDAPHAALANGVLIHNKNREADLFSSPDQLKPFALISQAYLTQLHKQGLATLFTSINMGDEYQKLFSEVLTVKSVGVLASLRGITQAEKNNVEPYKMVNATASTRLFDIFSKLVNQSSDPTVDRLANRAATITDEHFKNICAAFPGLTEQERPALLFALATLFVRYSSAAVFGTANDSPAALRFYASALLNKLKQLDENLFNQIKASDLQATLFEDACTDVLSGNMRSLATGNPTLRQVYDQVMPEMWK